MAKVKAMAQPKVSKPKTYKGKSTKPGEGGSFALLKDKLKGKVSNPGALAAVIGRKKYGAKKMESFSKAGKQRAKRKGK